MAGKRPTKGLQAFGPLRAHTVAVPTASGAKASGRRKRGRGRPARVRSGDGPEAQQQKRFVEWARGVGLEVQHQNNGAKTKAERLRLWAMGCTAGAADLIILDPLPNDPEARGLALEFKYGDGEQTPDQRAWERRVKALGWRYHVVWSAEEAVEVVAWYGLPVAHK